MKTTPGLCDTCAQETRLHPYKNGSLLQLAHRHSSGCAKALVARLQGTKDEYEAAARAIPLLETYGATRSYTCPAHAEMLPDRRTAVRQKLPAFLERVRSRRPDARVVRGVESAWNTVFGGPDARAREAAHDIGLDDLQPAECLGDLRDSLKPYVVDRLRGKLASVPAEANPRQMTHSDDLTKMADAVLNQLMPVLRAKVKEGRGSADSMRFCPGGETVPTALDRIVTEPPQPPTVQDAVRQAVRHHSPFAPSTSHRHRARCEGRTYKRLRTALGRAELQWLRQLTPKALGLLLAETVDWPRTLAGSGACLRPDAAAVRNAYAQAAQTLAAEGSADSRRHANKCREQVQSGFFETEAGQIVTTVLQYIAESTLDTMRDPEVLQTLGEAECRAGAPDNTPAARGPSATAAVPPAGAPYDVKSWHARSTWLERFHRRGRGTSHMQPLVAELKRYLWETPPPCVAKLSRADLHVLFRDPLLLDDEREDLCDLNRSAWGDDPVPRAGDYTETCAASLRLLLSSGMPVDTRSAAHGSTPLMYASQLGDAALVRELLNRFKASPNVVNASNGRTALDWAFTQRPDQSARYAFETALALIDAGAPVDYRDVEHNWTPLIYAVRAGNPEAARCLLARGADPRAIDSGTGKSVVELALARDELGNRGDPRLAAILAAHFRQRASGAWAPSTPPLRRVSQAETETALRQCPAVLPFAPGAKMRFQPDGLMIRPPVSLPNAHGYARLSLDKLFAMAGIPLGGTDKAGEHNRNALDWLFARARDDQRHDAGGPAQYLEAIRRTLATPVRGARLLAECRPEEARMVFADLRACYDEEVRAHGGTANRLRGDNWRANCSVGLSEKLDCALSRLLVTEDTPASRVLGAIEQFKRGVASAMAHDLKVRSAGGRYESSGESTQFVRALGLAFPEWGLESPVGAQGDRSECLFSSALGDPLSRVEAGDPMGRLEAIAYFNKYVTPEALVEVAHQALNVTEDRNGVGVLKDWRKVLHDLSTACFDDDVQLVVLPDTESFDAEPCGVTRRGVAYLLRHLGVIDFEDPLPPFAEDLEAMQHRPRIAPAASSHRKTAERDEELPLLRAAHLVRDILARCRA